jgi:Asp/Glu/hydantoin racemase
MLERLALGLGFASQLQHIELVLETGAQLLADRELALRVLAQACHKAAQTGVKSVILGGAGLAGYAADLQASVDLPLIDSVSAGVDLYLQRALPPSQRSFNGFDTTWTQMPPKMDFRLIDR